MELLWGLYINRSTWKTVYRPFGSIGFHAAAGIPAFRVQRVKNTNIDEDTATIKSEVRQTIKDMKAGIAPGMDGVDNIELVTYICQRAYQSRVHCHKYETLIVYQNSANDEGSRMW